MKICFSGRFDRPHCGHIATINKLRKMGDVVVVVLDYPEARYPIEYRVSVLKQCCWDSDAVSFLTSKTHFANISLEEFKKVTEDGIFRPCDVYAGGNEEVNEHMKSIGVPVLWVPRSFDYAASEEK